MQQALTNLSRAFCLLLPILIIIFVGPATLKVVVDRSFFDSCSVCVCIYLFIYTQFIHSFLALDPGTQKQTSQSKVFINRTVVSPTARHQAQPTDEKAEDNYPEVQFCNPPVNPLLDHEVPLSSLALSLRSLFAWSPIVRTSEQPIILRGPPCSFLWTRSFKTSR